MTDGNRRVLMVGPSLRFLGGQAVQAERLVAGLRTLPGLSIEYLVVDPVLPRPFRWMQQMKFVRTVATSLAYGWSLVRRIPSADVVHVFSASYWSFLLAPAPALLLARLFGKRVILNYHSGEADDHLTRWGWHAKPLIRLAQDVIVPTAYLMEVFAKHGIRAVAIANHVNVTAMAVRHRTEVRPNFFSNRNFEVHYNVCAIIDAFAHVQAEYPQATLVVAGNGSLRGALEAQVAALGLRHVRFTGPVPPQDMAALYAEADVFVNASLIDNMPLSLLEAYAACLPVITSNAGGIPWIAKDAVTARVFSAGDTAALQSCMLEVLREPSAALERAKCARAYVEAQFSWERVSDSWRRAYFAGRSATA
jgi:L-malate glycosyltransferase